jgi:Lrp/AsnC family transcriptional regulator, regulator for asnA, asnC and gidA
MRYKLDKIDRAIVSLLQEDGRMSCIEIARRLENVTERLVRGRIKRMTEEGIIQVSAFVNPAMVGYPVSADVWVEVEANLVMEVGNKLTELDQVSYVACATGDQNISMQINAMDMAELYRFVTDVVGKIVGVKRFTIRLIPIILKDLYEWAIPVSALTNGKEAKEKS